MIFRIRLADYVVSTQTILCLVLFSVIALTTASVSTRAGTPRALLHQAAVEQLSGKVEIQAGGAGA